MDVIVSDTKSDGTVVDRVERRMIDKSEGFCTIFNEVRNNAYDRLVQPLDAPDTIEQPTKTIWFTVDTTENFICIKNDGDSIPVVRHTTHDEWIPTMVLGQLLTSSNFKDDEQKRHSGGRNGYGAKLTNIFSTRFEIDLVDHRTKQRFQQTFTSNMEHMEKAKITKNKSKPYTQIKFWPDLQRFGLSEITKDHVDYFLRRAYDIVGMPPLGQKVKVFWNNRELKVGSFDKYCYMFLDAISPEIIEADEADESVDSEENDSGSNTETSDSAKSEKSNYTNRWKKTFCSEQQKKFKVGVAFVPNNDQIRQISSVNGIHTERGGTHLDHITKQLADHVSHYLKTVKKIKRVSTNMILDNMCVFVDALVINPKFDSQTKKNMTTPLKNFGDLPEDKCVLSKKFLEKVTKTGLVDHILNALKLKDLSSLDGKGGRKTNRIKGIPKLEDAEWAGTKKSKECTLILAEGDSAKASAMSGIGVVGFKSYGVLPLKGKLLNVREASPKVISNNEEIGNLIRILGLQFQGDYMDPTVVEKLRYGSILIFTDQDEDGYHIKGLLMNFLEFFCPSLIREMDYVRCLPTPIVKARKGNTTKSFYSLPTYEQWKSEQVKKGTLKSFTIKYYKGLGTSGPQEAREYFKNIQQTMVRYVWSGESDMQALLLAFKKEMANDRKKWLKTYDRNQIVDNDLKTLSFNTFINDELKHFSNEDNLRSIPSIYDGLKPSQRKVLFGARKRNLRNKELKVSQLSGYIADVSHYHHGEASLIGAIVGMAQNFCGSNNLNLLRPIGQFGTRLLGGKDAASARYIHTDLDPVSDLLFPVADDPVLGYMDDDGVEIEPEHYIGVIPLGLVNGAEGIGTGYSTYLAQHRPEDIISAIQERLDEPSEQESYVPTKEFDLLEPYYRGFTGTVHKKDGKWIVRGTYELDEKKQTIRVTELPVGMWTNKYKEFLEKQMESKKPKVLNYLAQNTDVDVNFLIQTTPEHFKTWAEDPDQLYVDLKLQTSLSTTNIHLYRQKDGLDEIYKYADTREILVDHFGKRLGLYDKRKTYQIAELEYQITLLNSKIRFIDEVLNQTIIMKDRTIEQVLDDLSIKNYPKLGSSSRTPESDRTYDYITNLGMFSMTATKKDKMKQELEKRKSELDKLQKTTIRQLWKTDLESLRKGLEIHNKKWEDERKLSMEAKPEALEKKKKPKKTKK
jgi:DNA topoisomerase-2